MTHVKIDGNTEKRVIEKQNVYNVINRFVKRNTSFLCRILPKTRYRIWTFLYQNEVFGNLPICSFYSVNDWVRKLDESTLCVNNFQ